MLDGVILYQPFVWNPVGALFIPEDPCPRTRPRSARTGPRMGVVGNEKCSHWGCFVFFFPKGEKIKKKKKKRVSHSPFPKLWLNTWALTLTQCKDRVSLPCSEHWCAIPTKVYFASITIRDICCPIKFQFLPLKSSQNWFQFCGNQIWTDS